MGTLRIIAGEQRGRRIAVPRGGVVRPTAERAREALFSILGSRIAGARVLDAYAGSGALGFEALSRGAARATFVDADRRALTTLAANAARLGLEGRSTIRPGHATELLQSGHLAGPFELVLADPPWGSAEAAGFLRHVPGVLAREGIVVLELDGRGPEPETPGLERYRSAHYGRTALHFFRRPLERDG